MTSDACPSANTGAQKDSWRVNRTSRITLWGPRHALAPGVNEKYARTWPRSAAPGASSR